MEKILRIFSKEYGNLNQAALLLGSFAFLSQILALFRDRSFAHFIGPSVELDIYYAAFRVPDLIFLSVASLVSITVLIPALSSRMPESKISTEANKFLNSIFTTFFVTITAVSVLAFVLMPTLANLIAPGFSDEAQREVAGLSRIMLLSPVLLGLSNLFGGVTQIFRRFFIYALSPVFYNVGIIIGVLFLYPEFGLPGLGFGVALGAFLHLVIQVVSSWSLGFLPRFSKDINFTEIKQTVSISLPRTLGLSFNNVALLAIVAFASFLSDGSISIFNLSLNLQSVPLGIIGLSYAVAAFPTLSKSYSSGALKDFENHLKVAARQIIFWSLPVTFLFIVLRAQIVRVILGSGYFSWENTRLVAAALAIFSVSITAQGLIALFARAYYARGDTKRPLYINLISSITIVVFAVLFLYMFKHFAFFSYFIESVLKVAGISGTEVLMLPLAYTLGTTLNFSLLWFFIKKDFMGREHFIFKTFFQSLCASFFIGAVAYLGLNIFSPIFGTVTLVGVLLQGLLSGVLGIIAGVLVLHLLGNNELRDLIKTLRTKFWRTKVIAPTQEAL